jgi:hypothetical protein
MPHELVRHLVNVADLWVPRWHSVTDDALARIALHTPFAGVILALSSVAINAHGREHDSGILTGFGDIIQRSDTHINHPQSLETHTRQAER